MTTATKTTQANRKHIDHLVKAAQTGDDWTRGYAKEALKELAGGSPDWRTRQLAKLALTHLLS